MVWIPDTIPGTATYIYSGSDYIIGFHADATTIISRVKNVPELPELPTKLRVLICNDNGLIGLPKLHKSLEELYCNNNNIKYLSFDNCSILRTISILDILNNPVSTGFNNNSKFQEYLKEL